MVSLKTQLQLPIYYHGKSKKNNYIFIIMVSLKRQLQQRHHNTELRT